MILIHVVVYYDAKLLQLCPTLCDATDCSPPGSSVNGIIQAGTLEWAAISFSMLCAIEIVYFLCCLVFYC